jgi:hypothetical protein
MAMALFGQTAMHWPHSMHKPLSIRAFPLAMRMAWVGQRFMQWVHPLQACSTM